MGRTRRDFPLSFFWGLVTVAFGIGIVGSGITSEEMISVVSGFVIGLLVALIGAWLVRRGWRLSRPLDRNI